MGGWQTLSGVQKKATSVVAPQIPAGVKKENLKTTLGGMRLMPSRAARQEAADGRPLLPLCVESYQNRSAICGKPFLGIFRRQRTHISVVQENWF